MIVALGLFVLLTLGLKVYADLSVTDTWMMAWVGGVLLLLATAAPSLWVALILAWIALQLPWRHLQRMGHCAPVDQITSQQAAVLGGAALYILLARSGQAADALWGLALVAIAWGVVNTGAAVWALRHAHRLPGRSTWKPGYPECGWCGSNLLFGWVCGLGLLGALYLRPWALLAVPILLVGLYLAKNLSAVAFAGAGCAVQGALTWGWPAAVLVGVPLVGCLVAGGRPLLFFPLTIRWNLWRAVVPALYRPGGLGLGFFGVARVQTEDDQRRRKHWDHLHNEWVQGFLELGPLPVVCGLLYLLGHALTAGATPPRIFAFGVVAATAVYALTYFPLHLPGQALPLLIAMASLDSTGG